MAWRDRTLQGNEEHSCLEASYPPRPVTLGRSTSRRRSTSQVSPINWHLPMTALEFGFKGSIHRRQMTHKSRSENGEYSPCVLATLQPWDSTPMLVFVQPAPPTAASTSGFSWVFLPPIFIVAPFVRRALQSSRTSASIPARQRRKARDSEPACAAGRNARRVSVPSPRSGGW